MAVVEQIASLSLEDGKPVTEELAKQFQALLFGKQSKTTKRFQEEWLQGIYFNPPEKKILQYGLVQKKGGPCGMLAAIQAYIIKNILFTKDLPDGSSLGDVACDEFGIPCPNESQKTRVLAKTLAEVIWNISEQNSIGRASILIPKEAPPEGKFNITDLLIFSCTTLKDSYNFVLQHLSMFTAAEGNGILYFLHSAILTRGIGSVLKDFDDPNASLIGMYGYCTQELVNLLVIGKAVSNVFDGAKDIDGMRLKGVPKRSCVGFLSQMEKYGNYLVGNNYKDPIYPIWIIFIESHFTVLFSPKPEIIEASWDLIFYDELGNQSEEYRISIELQDEAVEGEEEDLIPPLEDCVHTKWPTAKCNWNNSEALL